MNPLRRRRLAPALLLGAALAVAQGAYAQDDDAAAVSEAQVWGYKQRVANGCRLAGLHRGDARDVVDAWCGCLVRTLDASMSAADWQRAALYASLQREREAIAVLAPHARKVVACRDAAPPAPGARPS